METKLLRGEQEKDLQEAARLLHAGETVAFPTETVYGLGAQCPGRRCRAQNLSGKGPPF